MVKSWTIIVIAVVLLILAGLVYIVNHKDGLVIVDKIGGERDEHGCLGAAGYSYNESESACVREWVVSGEGRYQVENFYTCVQSGYEVMESYPRQCVAPNGDVFVEKVLLDEDAVDRDLPITKGINRHYCTGADRNAGVCITLFEPACGVYYNVKSKTFSNGCVACGDRQVDYWVEGEC